MYPDPDANKNDLVKHTYAATALLYRQTESGGMEMRCTSTAFEKTDKGYLFVTAAHCSAEDDTQHERVEAVKTRFYITFDEKEDKKFYPAKFLMAGYQHKGDDFSVFSVETSDEFPTVPLGDEHLDEAGDTVVNVASPRGLGKQVFHGWISSPYVDRPVVEDEVNWQGVMLLQIQSGPGSSGSAIISTKQNAIIGFLVGTYGENVFVMPVSRFKKFRQDVLDGKYKYFNKDAVVEAASKPASSAAKPKGNECLGIYGNLLQWVDCVAPPAEPWVNPAIYEPQPRHLEKYALPQSTPVKSGTTATIDASCTMHNWGEEVVHMDTKKVEQKDYWMVDCAVKYKGKRVWTGPLKVTDPTDLYTVVKEVNEFRNKRSLEIVEEYKKGGDKTLSGDCTDKSANQPVTCSSEK
jgi:hypothetical protein